MSNRSRQDELIRLLRRRGSTTVAQLTEALGVSRRTALRDIADLRDQGFIIRTTSGPVSSNEVFALLISVAVLKETHSIPFANLADAGLKKIEQALPRERVMELRKILKSVYIGQPDPTESLPIVSDIEPSVLPAFETSFLQSRRMQFQYMDRNLTPAWYIIGYDPAKQAFRHFRMDRVSKASVLDDNFQRRKLIVDEAECPFSTSFV